jgi:hypothetical protein
MKLTDLAMFLACIFIVLSLPGDLEQERSIQAEALKTRYNEVMKLSVKSASSDLIIPSTNISEEILAEGGKVDFRNNDLNLELALDKFYKNLFLNMGIHNDQLAQEELRMHIPIKVAVGYDGFFINTLSESDELDADGSPKIEELWKAKKSYSFYDRSSNIQIDFTLSDKVKVYDTNNNIVLDGSAEEMKQRYPNSIFTHNDYEIIKQKAITDAISDALVYYTVKNNEIASRHGFEYKFEFPYLDSNSITGVGFIAFLQGIPLNAGELYNTYGFSASKVTKSRKYYTSSEHGQKFYHDESCSKLVPGSKIYDSKEEAAIDGYYPCQECKP